MVSTRINESRGDRAFGIGVYVIATIILLIVAYPLIYVVSASFTEPIDILTGKLILFPKSVQFRAYKAVFASKDVLLGYRNTLIYAVIGTCINIVMTTSGAYCLSRRDMFGRTAITFMISFTMFFSGGMIPTYLVVNGLGIIDTIWAIVLPGAISTYNMIVMRTFFMGIPESLHEAACLDGASELQILVKVVLPLSKAILATMLLFYGVGHWNAYMNALLYLNKKSMFPLQSILRNMVVDGQLSEAQTQVGGGSSFQVVETTMKYAVIVVSTLPIVMIYPFVQKYFVKGVMIGSVKG